MHKDEAAAAPRRGVPDDHPIALMQSSSLTTLVQRELTKQIIAGDLAAGAKLNEVDVALRLGVSRGPVREAFRALEESGLVRFEKNRGVYVRKVSLEEADEIFELRALLDEFAGRRAAKNATPGDIAGLQQLVDRMGSAAGAVKPTSTSHSISSSTTVSSSSRATPSSRTSTGAWSTS